MNCVVIFFGEETTQTQLRLTELIRDMKLETSHTLKATTEAQLSAQLKEGGNLAGLVIVIGGLDPLKNISAKNALCATYGLSLQRSQKLYQQIEHLCQESGVQMNKRLENISLLPEGFTPMLFGGITYGMSGVVNEHVVMVIPDTIEEESISALKGVLMTTIVNQKRILAKHRVVQSDAGINDVADEEKGLVAAAAATITPHHTRSGKKSHSNDHLATFFIGFGALAVLLLLVFAIYLMGGGRDNPLFTLNPFSEPSKHESSDLPPEDMFWEQFISDEPLEEEDNFSTGDEISGEDNNSSEDSSSEINSSSSINKSPSSSAPVSSSSSQASSLSTSSSSSVASSSSTPASSSSTPTSSSSAPASSSSEVASSSMPEEIVDIVEDEEEDEINISGELEPAKGKSYSEQTLKVNVNGAVKSYDANELIAMILQNETRGVFHPEALKAHAVATYSYVKYYNNNGSYPVVALKEPVVDAIWDAIDAVDGYAVYYNDKIANTVYNSTSAGYTMSAKNVWGSDLPYLQSVESPWDKKSAYYSGTYTISEDNMASRISSSLGVSPSGDPTDWIKINEVTDGGYVLSAKVAGKTVTGRYIRETLLSFAIRSCSFKVSFDGENFIFKTQGYGHGVGMSQYGAHYMAQDNGSKWYEILEHYFTGIEIL